MGVRIEHLCDHLEALFRQEGLVDYQVSDYIGARRFPIRRARSMPLSNQQLSPAHQQQAASPLQYRRLASFPQPVGWEMTSQARWQIGEWFHQMTDMYSFPPEFAAVSMNILDRVLSRTSAIESKDEVQLLALTGFYLTVKLYQAGPVLSIRQMSALSGGTYTTKSIEAMEKIILVTLKWRLHPPIQQDFLRPFVLILGEDFPLEGWREILDLSLGMLDLSVLDYYFVQHRAPPSHLAMAALLNAMESNLTLGSNSDYDPIAHVSRKIGTEFDLPEISLCRKRLWAIWRGFEGAALYPQAFKDPEQYYSYPQGEHTLRSPTSPTSVLVQTELSISPI